MTLGTSLRSAVNRTARTGLRGGVSAIGLDFGSARLHAAQVVRRGRRVELIAAASMPRGAGARPGIPTQDEAALLADRLWRLGFIGNRAAVLPGREALFSATVEVPAKAPPEAIRQIARAELARLTRRDPAGLEVETWPMPSLGRKGQPDPAAAVAVDRSRLITVADLLSAVGLDLIHVDADGAVLAAAAHASGVQSDQRLCAVLDLGAATSRVITLYGGVAVYERSMPGAGVSALWDRLGSELGVDRAEAQRLLSAPGRAADDDISAEAALVVAPVAQRLAEDTATAIGYVAHRFRQDAVGRIVLAGGGAACRALVDAMDRRLGVPVDPLTPAVAGIAASGSRLERAAMDPALTAAAMLAVRSAGSEHALLERRAA